MTARKKSESIVGKRYGRWTVLEAIHRDRGHELRCRCECGTERIVAAISLRNGSSKSCGCARAETWAKKDLMTDPKKTSPKANRVISMVSSGYLPSVDQFMPDGTPTWSLESMALILDVEADYLEAQLKAAGTRFDIRREQHNGDVW